MLENGRLTCPECGVPEEGFHATATTLVTATLDETANVSYYEKPMLDEVAGYRDIRCGSCDHEVGDLPIEDIQRLRPPEPGEESAQSAILMRVEANLDLHALPDELARDARAHAALFHEALRRGLWPQRSGLSEGRFIDGYVEDDEQQVMPMLASLYETGYSYCVYAATDDVEELHRLRRTIGPGAPNIEPLWL